MDELDGLLQRFAADAPGVAHAACLDMGVGNGREGGGGETDLHGLAASAEEFEFKLAEHEVGAGHARAAPAFVQGKSARGELVEYVCLLLGDFSFFDGPQ